MKKKETKKKEIQFNPDEFLKAVEDVRDHVTGKKKITLRTTEVKLPPPAPDIFPPIAPALRAASYSSSMWGVEI